MLGVLDAALEGRRYLVGDKMTIADLSFVPWHSLIPVRLFYIRRVMPISELTADSVCVIPVPGTRRH